MKDAEISDKLGVREFPDFGPDASSAGEAIDNALTALKTAAHILAANARNFERFDEAADAIDYWNNNACIGRGEACWSIDGGRYHNITEWLYAPMYTGKKKEEGERK